MDRIAGVTVLGDDKDGRRGGGGGASGSSPIAPRAVSAGRPKAKGCAMCSRTVHSLEREP